MTFRQFDQTLNILNFAKAEFMAELYSLYSLYSTDVPNKVATECKFMYQHAVPQSCHWVAAEKRNFKFCTMRPQAKKK